MIIATALNLLHFRGKTDKVRKLAFTLGTREDAVDQTLTDEYWTYAPAKSNKRPPDLTRNQRHPPRGMMNAHLRQSRFQFTSCRAAGRDQS
jgi:hypothetical protein